MDHSANKEESFLLVLFLVEQRKSFFDGTGELIGLFFSFLGRISCVARLNPGCPTLATRNSGFDTSTTAPTVSTKVSANFCASAAAAMGTAPFTLLVSAQERPPPQAITDRQSTPAPYPAGWTWTDPTPTCCGNTLSYLQYYLADIRCIRAVCS